MCLCLQNSAHPKKIAKRLCAICHFLQVGTNVLVKIYSLSKHVQHGVFALFYVKQAELRQAGGLNNICFT